MPRDLADVLHYFLPELDDEAEPAPPALPQQDPALPILGVPTSRRDVVRAAFIWNFAIETARLGGRAIVLAPETDLETPLWPAPGDGPLGTELVFCNARDPEELGRIAVELARENAVAARQSGTVYVRVPAEWIAQERQPACSIDWWLLMTSADRGDLETALQLARAIRSANPASEIGATIHGVSTIGQAKRAYEFLAGRCEAELSLALVSYGLLVDDLHVYRAIAAQRAIGLAHPQAPATRAIQDVARLLYGDARSQILG